MFCKRQQKNFREKVDYIHSHYFHQLLIKLIEVIFFYLKVNAINTNRDMAVLYLFHDLSSLPHFRFKAIINKVVASVITIYLLM